jgi:DNA-binding transcriptional MerR regulator
MSELASIFGVAPQTVDAWVRKGLPCDKSTKGKVLFNTADVVDWRELQAAERASSGVTPSASIEEARLRKINGEAILVEMEIAEKRAELVPIADTVSVVAELCTAIRAKCLSVPVKTTPLLLAAEPTAAEFRAILDRAMREVLNELSADAAVRAEAGGVRDGAGDDQAATDDDGVGVGGHLSQAFL